MVQEGWKWVAVHPEYPYSYTHDLRRIYPHQEALSDEEQAKLDELVSRHDALVAEHGEDAPEDVVAELNRLVEQIVAIQRRAESYAPEDISRAGAIVALSSEGMLRIERGFIKPEDEQPSSDEAPGDGNSTPPEPAGNTVKQGGASENGKVLSNQLMENLTAQRTIALQQCLTVKPDVALMAVVHALALRIFYRQEARSDSCLGLEAKVADPGTFAPDVNGSRAGQALARQHEEWARRMPADLRELWGWIATQEAETLLALLAYCAARTADAVHRSWERGTRALRHADELALAVKLDMADWWSPTRDSYLAHVSKAQILDAVREGVSERDADNLAGLKKDAMIDHAERLLADTRWLPTVLRGNPVTAAASEAAAG